MEKPRYELWGEMTREVGVLLLVFGPLDFLVEYSKSGHALEFRQEVAIAGCALLGALLMVLGVELERR
jgi:uncharacterized membrane protein